MTIRNIIMVWAAAMSLTPSANANSIESKIPYILEVTQAWCGTILWVNVHDVLMDIIYCSNDTTPIGDFDSTGSFKSINHWEIADTLRDNYFNGMSEGNVTDVSPLLNLPVGSEYFWIDSDGKAFQLINGPIWAIIGWDYNCTQKTSDWEVTVTCDATVDTSRIPWVLIDTCKLDSVGRSEIIFTFSDDNPVKYTWNANTKTCSIINENKSSSDFIIEEWTLGLPTNTEISDFPISRD